jgi:hypothetical protein
MQVNAFALEPYYTEVHDASGDKVAAMYYRHSQLGLSQEANVWHARVDTWGAEKKNSPTHRKYVTTYIY